MSELAQLRRNKGFSQRTLAEAARVSPSTIHQLERRIHKTAHPTTVKKLADALGVEVAEVWEAISGPKGSAPPPRAPSLNDALAAQERRSMAVEHLLLSLEGVLGDYELIEEARQRLWVVIPDLENILCQENAT